MYIYITVTLVLYLLFRCESNDDDCASNPCLHEAECIDGINSYECVCRPGYTGTLCETNINDCEPNPCANNGVCTDLVNG